MSNYRSELVKSVKLVGQSLIDNADDIVDQMNYHTSFGIEIDVNRDGIPTIRVIQEHIAYIRGGGQ